MTKRIILLLRTHGCSKNIIISYIMKSKTKKIGKRIGRKTMKHRTFLYNPDDPKKSFDVYIDKDPSDTIPIKYATIDDVSKTIKKLENLYKKDKYSHKRIWQVGMIMRVRLAAMLKHKKELYPNAKKVRERYNLANRYYKFLKERTKKKSVLERKRMIFEKF